MKPPFRNLTLPDIGLAWADFLVRAAHYYTWLREPAGKKGQEHFTAALCVFAVEVCRAVTVKPIVTKQRG